MNRRDFLKWLAGLPSVYWPMLAFFDRLFWTPKLIWTPTPIITPSCDEFTEWLVIQTPRYDELVVKDIRMTDVWIRHAFHDLKEDWKRSETGLLVPDA